MSRPKPVGDIVVYTLGWLMDEPIKDRENPNGLLHSRIVVDGVEVKAAHKITIDAEGGDFVSATLHLAVTGVRFVALTDEQFKADELPELPE